MDSALIDCLERHAKATPEKLAIEDAFGHKLAYSQLYSSVVDAAAQFKGKKADVFRARQSVDFVVRYLACHAAGVAAVPLEKDIPDKAFAEIEEMMPVCALPPFVADVLFTTGTTGARKGVMISHKAIAANAENLIAAQKFSKGLTFIITGPLNHIGSLSKLWPCIMVGATVHVFDGLKDLNAFFRVVEDAAGKVATFQVPASLRMIMRLGASQLRNVAEKFDFIETGAAPMPQADMEELCGFLPNARLYNTYASTETGIISTHDFNAGFCQAGCLGRPMTHCRIEICGNGMIVCSGDTLMTGYLGDSAATEKVLYGNAMHTSDCGYIDSEGRLRLASREGDAINAGGFKINPVEVENAALACEDVEDCICVASPHPVLGTALRLIVATKGNVALDKKKLSTMLSGRLERHKVPLLYTQASKINRTFNGKLDRKSYL